MSDMADICAWCNKEILEDVEVFGFGARARPGIDLSGQEGTIIQIPLTLESKTVPAAVVTSGSEAKKQGYDLAFLTLVKSALNR